MIEESIPWGDLRLCRDPRPYIGKQTYERHDDDYLLLGDDERWGSLNILIAPLWSTEGDLLGAIAVDCGGGRKRCQMS